MPDFFCIHLSFNPINHTPYTINLYFPDHSPDKSLLLRRISVTGHNKKGTGLTDSISLPSTPKNY